MTYFHSSSIRDDPDELLLPENQFSTPWGSADHGRCDKCGGVGEVDYECLSCLEDGGKTSDCPGCDGRVTYRDVCPTCEGSGEITRTKRRGVSAFPTKQGLRRYLHNRDVDTERYVMVELEGRLSDDLDLDADSGAILIFPTKVVEVSSID